MARGARLAARPMPPSVATGGVGPPRTDQDADVTNTERRSARAVAFDALLRIERDDAYANLALGALLERSALDERDRAFVTGLVYGCVRGRRRLDHLADRFLTSDPPPEARMALRLGAFQLTELGTPPHAAIGETVGITPKRYRGLVNAVLRRIATTPVSGWPNPGTELSYPDWIVDRLGADLGERDAIAALAAMNEAPGVTTRPDGYVQDLASQWVSDLVEARAGQLVLDCCAAPGGKATAVAGSGARVVAADRNEVRLGVVRENVRRLGADVALAVADAGRPPWRAGSFDRVLVDAPCSGLGVLRRRPDARWRVVPGDVDRLAKLQRRLVEAAVPLVASGGLLIYSVCTLTRAETVDVAETAAGVAARLGVDLVALDAPPGPWRPAGTGALLLPHDAGTDGMFVARWRVGAVGPPDVGR